jgi:hypothetical protein
LLLTDFMPAVGGETRIADLHWHDHGRKRPRCRLMAQNELLFLSRQVCLLR